MEAGNFPGGKAGDPASYSFEGMIPMAILYYLASYALITYVTWAPPIH